MIDGSSALGLATTLRFSEVPGERLMATHLSKARLHTVLNLPELNIALFAFLLNFIWEMLQIPFFRGMVQMRHWDAVLLCTRATLGDAGIVLAAFWTVAWLGGGRDWPLRPSAAHVAGFAAVGVTVTIAFELLATKVWDRWSYAEGMSIAQHCVYQGGGLICYGHIGGAQIVTGELWPGRVQRRCSRLLPVQHRLQHADVLTDVGCLAGYPGVLPIDRGLPPVPRCSRTNRSHSRSRPTPELSTLVLPTSSARTISNASPAGQPA